MQSKVDWERIERFVGYGRIDAPVVFVGIEEGLSSKQLEKNLQLRSGFEPVMDLAEAHQEMDGTEALFREVGTKLQRTWRPMCDLMLRREGSRSTPPTLLERKTYQRKELGRAGGETLLSELLPYPNVKTTHWAYPSRFPSREKYVEAVLESRISLLAKLLASSKRELIVCYGKSRWPDFRRLISRMFGSSASWVSARNGLFQTTVHKHTRIVLSGHFSTKYFNTQADLDTLATVALASSTLPDCSAGESWSLT